MKSNAFADGRSVKQNVAQTMRKDDYILLAGDAAHTHSSAFAQGMNTGVHDATNPIWKLAGTLKGWYKPGSLRPTTRSGVGLR
jgi:phenol 2-monooxygenase